MITVLIIVFISGLILLLYIFRISGYAIAIRRKIKQPESIAVPGEISVSLLIPFRNEAMNLPDLILDTKAQLYPSTLFEVIFINDHSEDESVEIIERLIRDTTRVKIIHLPDHQHGKKAAISLGVEEAQGDWIIQTDADCRIPPGFISEHASHVRNDKQTFIAGPVILRETEKLWNKIEILEFMSLTGSSIGSFLTGKPVMCNGANISYSKDFYVRNERELSKINSPSGDDMFLLAMAKKEGIDTEYLFSEESAVTTYTTGTPLNFLRQRIRWGSKARYYRDFDILYLAFITFLANASILGFLVSGFFNPSGFLLFGVLLIVKSLADLFLLIPTALHFQRSRLLWYFPLVALFYYFYLIIVGALSFVAGYRWKGRKY